jgi:DHA1 family multidrug resistance protein-like MFS transporter
MAAPVEKRQKLVFSPFLLLCGIGLFAIFSSTMSKNPALPLFAKDLGATEQYIGLIAAASTVVGVLTSIPAGALSDLYGRRRVILFATFVFASAPFLYLFVSSPWQLALVRVYHGLATAIFGPVAMALVADFFQIGRGESMGWYSSSTLIGRAAAPFVGGTILAGMAGSAMGGSGSWLGLTSYQWVYVVCGGAGLIAMGAATRLPVDNRTRGGATFGESWAQLRRGLRDVVRSRPILVTSVMEALQYFSYGAMEAFLPLYAIFFVEPRLSTVEVGTIFLAQILTTALTKPLMGRTSDRMGRRPVIALGLVLSGVSMALFVTMGSFLLLFTIGMLYGLGLSVVTSATSAYVSELAKAGQYGSALGVLSMIMDVGQSTGPIVVGIIVATAGYRPAFFFVAALLLVGTAGFWFLAPQPSGERPKA